jgi:hypothetical protein
VTETDTSGLRPLGKTSGRCRGHLALLGRKVRRDRRDYRVFKATLALPVQPGRRVLLVQLARKVQSATPARPGRPVRRVIPAKQVRRGRPGHLALPGRKDRKVLQVHRVQPAQLVLKVRRVKVTLGTARG